MLSPSATHRELSGNNGSAPPPPTPRRRRLVKLQPISRSISVQRPHVVDSTERYLGAANRIVALLQRIVGGGPARGIDQCAGAGGADAERTAKGERLTAYHL